jgi:hypothetical protein
MSNIPTGALIQVVMGADEGRLGTVIGLRPSGYGAAILVVFFDDNKLDICVLPEMVRVLSAPEPSDVVWLSDDEMQILFCCD